MACLGLRRKEALSGVMGAVWNQTTPVSQLNVGFTTCHVSLDKLAPQSLTY